MYKTVRDIDLAGKTVLYRSPYDIGVKEENGKLVVKDDSRIAATIPTLNYLIEQNCKIVVLTWVKRPEGKVVEKLRTTPHAEKLSELLGREVKKADDCIGDSVQTAISDMQAGEILMLENTRFYSEEEEDDDTFAKELAKNGEIIVFDGFPQIHRVHASTTGLLRHLPGVIGLYFEKELLAIRNLLENPKKPFTLVIGGAKISDKVDAINNLIDLADNVLVGGGTANVFLKAQGKEMANSFIEDSFVDESRKEKKDWVRYAKEIITSHPGKIKLPVDVIGANDIDNPTELNHFEITESPNLIPEGWAALDIGPNTAEKFSNIIRDSNTIFWNGPMGLFENEKFSHGTLLVSKAIEFNKGMTVVGGGDTAEAAKAFSDLDSFSHVSLAGGASLEFLAGNKMPAWDILNKY